MSDDVFLDIADAVMALRRAFQKHNLNVPAAIELKTHEDGKRLRSLLPSNLVSSEPFVGASPDKPEIVANIAGVEIIWPAQMRAERRGGFRYE